MPESARQTFVRLSFSPCYLESLVKGRYNLESYLLAQCQTLSNLTRFENVAAFLNRWADPIGRNRLVAHGPVA